MSSITRKKDAAGFKGFIVCQKTTAALQQITWGEFADKIDEYVRMGKSTALACLM